jgi:hypothetical protein
MRLGRRGRGRREAGEDPCSQDTTGRGRLHGAGTGDRSSVCALRPPHISGSSWARARVLPPPRVRPTSLCSVSPPCCGVPLRAGRLCTLCGSLRPGALGSPRPPLSASRVRCTGPSSYFVLRAGGVGPSLGRAGRWLGGHSPRAWELKCGLVGAGWVLGCAGVSGSPCVVPLCAVPSPPLSPLMCFSPPRSPPLRVSISRS